MTNQRLRFQTLFLTEAMIPWRSKGVNFALKYIQKWVMAANTEALVKKVSRCLPILVTSLNWISECGLQEKATPI